MKIFVALFLVTLTYSSSPLQLSIIGESCDSSPDFNIVDFEVSPFPIYVNTPYTFTVSGQFLRKEYIEKINVAERYNSLLWKNTAVAVDLNFAKDENHTFTIYRDGPTLKGGYTVQVTFHRSDFSYVACWQYDFTI